MSLHGVSDSFGACLGLQLYLPESWDTAERRGEAKIPDAVTFKRKWEIALELLDAARDNDGPSLPVLADAGYGDSREFREGLRKRGLKYVVGISSQTSVWRPGTRVEVPKSKKVGRPRTRAEAVDGSEPVLVNVLARELMETGKFEELCWRRGEQGAR